MPSQESAAGHYLEPGVALFDRLAGLTRDPGAAFTGLTAAYADDPRLHVPATVDNALRNRQEPVLP